MRVISTDTADFEVILREQSLPQDGLNLAYWFDGTLICQDDSFRPGLEALDFSSVAENISIAKLEKKVLSGETGVGIYE